MRDLKVKQLGELKVLILPDDLALLPVDQLSYEIRENKLILDSQSAAIRHDRELIEKRFTDFAHDDWVDKDEMIRQFGCYGWGK
ncbi:hypothetical protein AYR62_14930 [Secundilactobacillus paracollinoides]|uniref:AbrB family transcriptional regulator n=1 Tax=Secundilactobacillus paracollinoides TaxID=240427 RepID=A0A1B2IX97_9LACO|nr:hypothetical protein [Secundilactobacillus paracollinoides]ANZ60856.1 hypothetical protein AYR61_05550 [Secundilactobacillus paracollinoides]ANZ65243.1 hypothetical protein AYR62_14930 [Secundilactobacillus paracollinoides]ANZ66714.1 hypothetical protein AYR63_05920 [Secundilactobacillus paracollinoides]